MFKYCFRFSTLLRVIDSPQPPEVKRISPKLISSINHYTWSIRPFENQVALPIYKFSDASYSGQSIFLDEDCFNQPLRRDILHRTVRYITLLYKKVLQPTITMSEAAASGIKVLPQKKTGKARQGHRQRPGRYKGVKAHGRKIRSLRIGLPRKVRLLGLKVALSSALYDDRVMVIDSETIPDGKTKTVLARLNGFANTKHPILVIHGESINPEFERGAKNIQFVNCCPYDRVNVLKLLRNKTIIFTKEGIEGITQFLKQRTLRSQRKLVREKKVKFETEGVEYDPNQPLDLKFKVLREYLEDFEKLKSEGKLDEFIKAMPQTKKPGRFNSVDK